jgi:zinc transport system permease protein
MYIIILALICASISLSISGVLSSWYRISNLGDSISHSFVFVICISYFLNCNEIIAIVIAAILFVFFISGNLDNKKIDDNTKLMIISSFSISSAIFLSEYTNGEISLKELLFGNIFSVKPQDLLILAVIMAINIGFVFLKYKQIVLSCFSHQIAKSIGINIFILDVLLKFIIVITSAICIKILGALLITSLIILPATISRLFSSSPKAMILIAIIISIISSLISINLSFSYDLSYSATLAMCLSITYFCGVFYTKLNF